MDLKVSKASQGDVKDMVAILSDGVVYKQAHHDNSWGDQPYDEAEVKGLLDSGSAYVARLGDQIVGTFLLQWTDDVSWDSDSDDGGYVHQFAVRSGFHGQDIGKQILDWAGEEAKRRGKKFLRLDCHEDNQKLCAYYESQGFTQVGAKSIPQFNNYTAALFERKL